MKNTLIEFLFNEKKYKVHKFLFFLVLIFVAMYIFSVFQLSLLMMYIPFLFIIAIQHTLKVFWYNKKKEIKTDFTDKVSLVLITAVLIGASVVFYQEEKLENTVEPLIEERLGDQSVAIENIVDLGGDEKTIIVEYTIEGESTSYASWYDLKNGEWIHDKTKKHE